MGEQISIEDPITNVSSSSFKSIIPTNFCLNGDKCLSVVDRVSSTTSESEDNKSGIMATSTATAAFVPKKKWKNDWTEQTESTSYSQVPVQDHNINKHKSQCQKPLLKKSIEIDHLTQREGPLRRDQKLLLEHKEDEWLKRLRNNSRELLSYVDHSSMNSNSLKTQQSVRPHDQTPMHRLNRPNATPILPTPHTWFRHSNKRLLTPYDSPYYHPNRFIDMKSRFNGSSPSIGSGAIDQPYNQTHSDIRLPPHYDLPISLFPHHRHPMLEAITQQHIQRDINLSLHRKQHLHQQQQHHPKQLGASINTGMLYQLPPTTMTLSTPQTSSSARNSSRSSSESDLSVASKTIASSNNKVKLTGTVNDQLKSDKLSKNDLAKLIPSGCPLSYKEIVNDDMDTFNDKMVRHRFTEELISTCKEIRKREKNRQAAKRSRQNHMDYLDRLRKGAQSKKELLLQEKSIICQLEGLLENKTIGPSVLIERGRKNDQGNPVSPYYMEHDNLFPTLDPSILRPSYVTEMFLSENSLPQLAQH